MNRHSFHRNCFLRVLLFSVFCFLFSGIGFASPALMPDVTAEMSNPYYWAALQQSDANAILANETVIHQLNNRLLFDSNTNMYDLLHMKGYVNTIELSQSITASLSKDAHSYCNGKYFDRSGNPLNESSFAPLIVNATDPRATASAPLQYAVAVNRTIMLSFPGDLLITDQRGDVDFDYNVLSAIRVNEPLVIKLFSLDHQYAYVYASHCQGWVPTKDIVVCHNYNEWTDAWNIPSDQVLVITDGKVFLNESNFNSSVSNRMLTMGTILRIAPKDSYGALINNRAAYQNYVVYLPARNADGSYRKELALISQNQDVHEGYVPLTTANILRIAFNMLGDNYGWGGMLSSEDCSGYLRAVYKCFGLELARNTSWQSASPLFHYDVSSFDDTQKMEILNNMPAGSILFFRGHEMMYLGQQNGKYYVLSACSSMANIQGPGIMRTRGIFINTLDVKRANGTTWLRNIHTMQVPYYPAQNP